ncbi:hypothetical protein ACFTZK_07190 [Streptomyces decoyicus]|uniref:hypothetical protein n=2 Tax=Streptomyces decoyicus TaxID=249567 RepID=UPI0034017310
MDKGIRRMAGVILMVAGIACDVWLGFGAPNDWDGAGRVLRFGLGLAATGAITWGAGLIFWQPKAERSEAADVA